MKTHGHVPSKRATQHTKVRRCQHKFTFCKRIITFRHFSFFVLVCYTNLQKHILFFWESVETWNEKGGAANDVRISQDLGKST